MALPTSGRVVLETTVGDIDIELWAKETPKACRNFLALAMEGYYDGVIFHRVVPGFLVQAGDRTGTGQGGESFYGDSFEDEIHPRLRFSHRGIVAMANHGSKNSYDSQFIITLDRAEELHGKHTLFGRCVGNSIYNVLKIGEMELDDGGKPVYPPKIKQVRIVENPFDDIIPRITAAEKRAQQLAKEQNQREREEAARRKGAKKNVTLLSFGGDEGAEEEPATFKKKGIARPDLVAAPSLPDAPKPEPSKKKIEDPRPNLDDEMVPDPPVQAPKAKKEKKTQDDAASERPGKSQNPDSAWRLTEIEKLEQDIRKLSRRRAGEDEDEDEQSSKKKRKGPSILEQERMKYQSGMSQGKKGKKKEDGDIMAQLGSFRSKLKSTSANPNDADVEMQIAEGKSTLPDPEDPGQEVDDDTSWAAHVLQFPKDNGEETIRAERDYEVIDPRARKAQAKEEEDERKRSKKSNVGEAFRRRR